MKWFLIKLSKLLVFSAFLSATSPAQAGTVIVPGVSGGGFMVKVTSLKEARFRSTILQQYDFSCGSAALATLLTYHYEDKVSEQDVFKFMFDTGDQEKIRKNGFSLLDMKNYLEANGYRAAGYQITLDKLAEIGVPAIVLINIKGYKHFVVVKGISAKMVLLSDPAAGARTIPRAEFESMWNGLIFIILNKKNVAKNHFNRDQEWHVKEKAPLGLALNARELANVTLMLPGVLR
ncbi:C39 family peptidase [Geotalea uraniireducens]|uniref:C39 family peptidase n=1 Tax=Geotalea uraniireducens TaxID=351604 RepID=UPI00059EB9C9|nr:C39 family peptidase [Geotalea uraniireducens]